MDRPWAVAILAGSLVMLACLGTWTALAIANPGEPSIESAKVACEDGDPIACWEVGEYHWYHGAEQDPRLANTAFEQACALGRLHWQDLATLDAIADSCFKAGMGLGRADADQDPARAYGFHDLACGYGDPDGCLEVARAHDSGRPSIQDATLAYRYYARACALGSDFGCTFAKSLADRQ